jgi:hypothetical protein
LASNDVEILFLYPLAVSLYHVSFLGFWIAIFFILIITIGFLYELASNVLDYAKSPSSSSFKKTPRPKGKLPIRVAFILLPLMTSLNRQLRESVSVTKEILSILWSIEVT